MNEMYWYLHKTFNEAPGNLSWTKRFTKTATMA